MASKSKRRRRVFRASCILAALIIAGSSFAWFTSRDEVTNRLSASANYGVSIVEDFQPPKNFLPGQKVNKDVAVVNTGNVDAFVRAWIDGEMSVVKREANGAGTKIVTSNAASNTLTTTLGFTATDANQTKLTGINLNWYDSSDNTKYYKELSQKKSENPKNSTNDTDAATETETDKDDENIPADFTEVQSVQAGGVLVYHDYTAAVEDNPDTTDVDESAAATGAEYYYVLEQATTITDNASVTATYPAGTYVCTPGSCIATDDSITNKVTIPYNYYGEIDTSQFFPESEGLYLFRRNVELANTANATDDYEYTGYYFFKDTSKTTTTATGEAADKLAYDQRDRDTYYPVYLALEYDNEHTQRSDYVLCDTDVTTNVSDPTKDDYLPVRLNDVRLFTAKEHILKSYIGTPEATYTVDGNTAEITQINGDDGVNVGGTTYKYKYVDGTDTYYGVSDSGTFYKNVDASNMDSDTTVQVVKGTQEALTWNFDAGDNEYTITDGTTSKTATGAPTQEASGPDDGTEYVWKIVADGTNYWSNAENGTYYAEASFTNGDGTPGSSATEYSVSSTSGTPSTGNGILYATYGTGDEQIRINVQLANLDNAPTASTAETWSVIKDESGADRKWTFYYNNDVEEGATTTKLIDSVELDSSVKDEAYLAFDFDLNVFMESAQVVIDENGAESGNPIVTPWLNATWAEGQATSYNTNYTPATAEGETTVVGNEITAIKWAATT